MRIDNDKLKLRLKEKGITKSQMANILSISSKTISKIAKGENLSKIVVEKICNFLECQPKSIIKKNGILETLRKEMYNNMAGGLYHLTQIKLTYNSNHIEGSRLSEEQTRFIFETQTLGGDINNVEVDDIFETTNHFKCIDFLIQNAEEPLTEQFIQNLHYALKRGTSDEKKYGIGVYKKLQNTVGGIETTNVQNVANEIKQLLKTYNAKTNITFEDIIDFHYKFEIIHPFQDGNGRVGRLIAFKECLKHNITPFYIDDKFKWEYYNGLKKYPEEKGYLIETCKLGQDLYQRSVNYFSINEN